MAGVRARKRHAWGMFAYIVALAAYVTGLSAWLSLGLLADLGSELEPVRHFLLSWHEAGRPLSGLAGRILGVHPTMNHKGWVVQYIFSGLNAALGVLLLVRRPRDTVPRLLSLAFLGTAATFNVPGHVAFKALGQPPLIAACHILFHVVSGIAYVWAVVLFPDGRLPMVGAISRATCVRLAVVGTALAGGVAWWSVTADHVSFFVVLFGILVPVLGVFAQLARIRRGTGSPQSRQQSRLLCLALVPALVVASLWLVARVGAAADAPRAEVAVTVIEQAFPAVFAVVPVVLFVAILRYRLWDIDVVMSRALLVTLFGGFVTAVVLLVLGISGRIFGDLGWSAVVAMTIVAFVAEEARDRSRRLANQLVFGEKLTPREAMRSLADRLSHAASADELTELARVVVASTRCTGACVWAVMDDHLLRVVQHPVIPGARAERVALEATTVAACRTALPGTYCAAVTHQGELAAMLALTLPTGVGLPRIERRLVRDLAQHAGLLVVNARLTSRLQQQVRVVAARAGELRASRQQLVAAQDNERHRLERDIHDGAQQELVVILLRIRALERLSVGRPVQEREIDGIREAVSRTRRTLLSLASGNPPRRLVEGGLAEALRDAAALATSAHLDVTVTCDSAARLPLDVQTAIYFCCLEALQNTVKHANAARADVHVDLSEDEVVFSVTDDGMGFNSARVGQGSGLGNLVGRLAVHAGTAQIFSAQGAGTQVRCRLPLTRDMVEAGS